MEEKKIATSVDILINIDRFEHLQITKYAERKITYETKEEMVQKEDQLTNELISDVRRSLKLSYEGFSVISKEVAQKMEAVYKIDDKITKKIPTWLEEGSDPNIANIAKKISEDAIAKSYANGEDSKEKQKVNNAETDAFLEGKPEAKSKDNETHKDLKSEEKDPSFDDDLFGDDDLFEK